MHTYRSNDKVKGRYEPVSNKPSMTVPDMAMSMAEIMARFKRGQELPLGANTYFDTDNGEVDFYSVDPTLDPAFDLSDYTRIHEDIKRKKENLKNSQLTTNDNKETVEKSDKESIDAEENKTVELKSEVVK